MSSTRSKKLIVKPGFHMRAKYDLAGLRRRRNSEGRGEGTGDLPLVSMIDMFSILVIYLLMNFSATGEIFFISKNVKLPEALHSLPIENAPLISISAESVTLDTDAAGNNAMALEEKDPSHPRLTEALRELRKLEQATHPDKPFKGNINIQADENVPLMHIKRVMQTCVLEGWSGINFAVRSKDGE